MSTNTGTYIVHRLESLSFALKSLQAQVMSEVNKKEKKTSEAFGCPGENIKATDVPLEQIHSLQTAILVIDALQKENSALKATIQDLQTDNEAQAVFRGQASACIMNLVRAMKYQKSLLKHLNR